MEGGGCVCPKQTESRPHQLQSPACGSSLKPLGHPPRQCPHLSERGPPWRGAGRASLLGGRERARGGPSRRGLLPFVSSASAAAPTGAGTTTTAVVSAVGCGGRGLGRIRSATSSSPGAGGAAAPGGLRRRERDYSLKRSLLVLLRGDRRGRAGGGTEKRGRNYRGQPQGCLDFGRQSRSRGQNMISSHEERREEQISEQPSRSLLQTH